MEALSPCELHKICRICLKNDLLVSIFSPTFLMQPIEMIEKLHIFKFQANDNLPTLLCQSCLYRLLDAFNLQQLAEASECQLRKYLNNGNQECVGFGAPSTPTQATIPTQGQELSKDADATAAIYANICEMFERNVSVPITVESVVVADDVLNDVEIDVSSLTRSEADDTLSEVLVGGHISCSSEAQTFETDERRSMNQSNTSSIADMGDIKLMHLKYPKRTRTCKALKSPDICLECGKVFKYGGYLEAHKRIHSGEKPFKCKICTKRFTQSSNLRLHQRTHSNEQRRFQCEVCAAFFTTSSNLKAHSLIHMERRDFQCQRCERSFKSERELRRHEPVHKATKDIICEQCQRGFTKRRYLSAHMAAVHQGVRRYKCAECGKVFGTKSNLVCHARIHSGEKPFKCPNCPWKFNQSSALVRHMKKHTKRKEQIEPCLKRQDETLMNNTLFNNLMEDQSTPITTAAAYPQQTNYNMLHALPHLNIMPMAVPTGISNQLSETVLSSTESTISPATTLNAYDFTKDGILDFSTSQQQPQMLY